MPQPKYVKRDYKKKFKTYQKCMVAMSRGENDSERKKMIKKSTKGSSTFNLTDKDIADILKPHAHIY